MLVGSAGIHDADGNRPGAQDALLQAYQRSLLGKPDAFKGVREASSPMTCLKAPKAPLLSWQGENDIPVPRGQAQEVADALDRPIEWFDKYLRPTK